MDYTRKSNKARQKLREKKQRIAAENIAMDEDEEKQDAVILDNNELRELLPVGVTKHKLYPSAYQKKQLKKVFGAAQFVYNRCVDFVIHLDRARGLTKVQKTQALRKYCCIQGCELVVTGYRARNDPTQRRRDCSWLNDLPYDIISSTWNNYMVITKPIRDNSDCKL